MKRTIQIFSLAILPLLVACGDAAKEVENRVKAPELMGTWQGEECVDSELLDASYRTFVKVDGDTLSQVHQFYTSADCEDPAARLAFEGELTLQSEQVDKRWAVSVLWNQSTLVALNDKGRDLLDGTDLCGVEEWKVGEKVDLTKQKDCLFKSMGREFNTMEGQADRLVLGELTFRDGTRDPNQRPGVTDGAVMVKTDQFPE